MSTQPEALQIAEIMEQKAKKQKTSLGDYWTDDWCLDAAAELRRLHEANQIMLEALNDIAAWRDGDVVGGWFDEPGSAQTARDAITKATGGNNGKA